jgi:predicted CoA-binding protein
MSRTFDAARHRRHLNDPDVVRRLLTERGRLWAVVGLSENPARVAHRIGRYLQAPLGMRIAPVHPKAEAVHGERGYARLADIGEPIDVVDVFVRSELAGAVVDEAVAAGARAVWLQLGVVDEDAAARATAAGVDVVLVACPAIEAPKLGLV